MNNESLN